MPTERIANYLLADYSLREYETRMAWQKVLAAPVNRAERKPVQKSFFSRFFKGIA